MAKTTYLFRLLVRFSNPDGTAPLDGPQGEHRLFDADGKVEYSVGKGVCLLCGCGAALLIPRVLTQPEHHEATPHGRMTSHASTTVHNTTPRVDACHIVLAAPRRLRARRSPPPRISAFPGHFKVTRGSALQCG